MTIDTTPTYAIDHARQVLDGFGSYLREARRVHAVTVRALAELTGVRADIINRIEKGTWCPSPDDHATLRDWLLQHPVIDDEENRDG